MSSTHRATIFVASFVALALLTLLSLGLGAESLSLAQLLHALAHPLGGGQPERIVIGLRLPRTAVALVAGAALGLAGAVMQGVTRNPLADPGLLGVNAGASLAVVTAIGAFGVSTASGYVWFAFGGAAVAAAVVYAIGVLGSGGATPVKLALAGAALTATLTSITTLVLLSHQDVFQQFRFWQVGSVAGRSLHDVGVIAPFAAVGAVLALVGGRMLDVLALGDDAARGLGLNVPLARAICAVAVVLLAGGATSIAGPVVFVGLVATHAARPLAGQDHRTLIALAGLVGAGLLVASDLIGRFIAPPGELEAGVVIALIGAPVMIALVRRRRAVMTA
ncbi:FecCD family ABC transporter permease [Gryllotalpicola protaetiae]|uniref:Iron ABC transporter permease n=1 Tax=Gryllotalpicola protaetiae TaxID=2419771 RepID=A0A387BPR1_9MICO|nr:iron ABC transporter permease [Gryllotalpicola protaetiae]AYG04472.1 iron ABC transporter permease [Gryllotalpicola protaetiae]